MKTTQSTQWQVGHGHGPLTLLDHSRIFMPGPIAAAVYALGGDQEQLEAAARLIAAAPKMLEALTASVEAYDAWANSIDGDGSPEPDYITSARAAIARATGGDQ